MNTNNETLAAMAEAAQPHPHDPGAARKPVSPYETQLQRVAAMEEIFDRSFAAVETLSRAAREYMTLKAPLAQLEQYYENGTWLSDFDAERANAFPQDMKRGILTEDAIYDLLTAKEGLKRLLKEVLDAM